MRPHQRLPRWFSDADPAALTAQLIAVGYVQVPTVESGEIARLQYGAELVVITQHREVSARGGDWERAYTRLLLMCEG